MPDNITTVAYIFLVVGGVITVIGSLIVYLNKKPKRKKSYGY